MSNELTVYQQKGLTADEAALVQKWVESGRPGIHNIKADFLYSIYNLGYSCQEIHKNFPEYPLAGILYARVKFDWDERKAKTAQTTQQLVAQAAAGIGAEAIRHLLMIVQATHVKNEREILAYLAAPDREKVPEILPKSLHQYGELLQTLKDLTTPEKTKDGPPQPSVFINAPGATVTTANPTDVAKAMIEQMKTAKKPAT